MSVRSLAGFGFLALFVSAVACSSGGDDESADAASQRVTSGDGTAGAEAGTARAGDGTGPCGFYEKKKCDGSAVVSYYANDLRSLIENTADCLGCGGALIGAGVVAMGGTISSAGLVSVPAGALATAVTAIGCEECWHELNDTGVIPLLECTFVPCEYSVDARQKECKLICDTDYSYVARGSTNCMCTNDLHEAECKLHCMEGYKVDDGCKCSPAASKP